MDTYGVYKILHVSAAVIWVGSTGIIVGLVGIALSSAIGMGMISPTGKGLGETVVEKDPTRRRSIS